MKKSLLFKCMSLLIAMTMLATLFVPAVTASESCTCGESPIIVVCGMGNYPFYKNAGTPAEEQVFPPSSDDITPLVVKAVGAILLSDATNNWDITKNAIIPDVYDMFEGFSCRPDGTSKYNVTTTTFDDSMAVYPEAMGNYSESSILKSSSDLIGADHTYCYNYDWRMSPLDNADELRELVVKAKNDTGHSKVSFAVASFGGVITMAYLYKYGASDIDSCVLLSTTFNGVDFVGDLFTGQVMIRENDLFNFLIQEGTDTETKATILSAIFKGLSAVKGTEPAARLIEEAFRFVKEDAYDEVLIPIFAYMPGLWSLVTDEDYEKGKEMMLDKATDSFIELIDEYHYNVFMNREQILQDAQDDGMKLYIFSHYNKVGYPLYDACEEQTDGLLETNCTSGGATCANYGETLPDGYKAENPVCTDASHNHISPDNIVDASTAMFPEQVWLISGYRHVGCRYGGNFLDYVITLLRSDEQLTVHSDSRYPQYLDVNGDENITTALPYAYIKGNCTLDSAVTTDDARMALRYTVGLENLNSTQMFLADVDGDGTVTTDDARKILRNTVGLETLG